MPFITSITPNALRYKTIQHQCPNLTLRHIVCRWCHRRIFNKQEITLSLLFNGYEKSNLLADWFLLGSGNIPHCVLVGFVGQSVFAYG